MFLYFKLKPYIETEIEVKFHIILNCCLNYSIPAYIH